MYHPIQPWARVAINRGSEIDSCKPQVPLASSVPFHRRWSNSVAHAALQQLPPSYVAIMQRSMTMRRPTKLSAITIQAYTQPTASVHCRFTTSVTRTFDGAASRLAVLPHQSSSVSIWTGRPSASSSGLNTCSRRQAGVPHSGTSKAFHARKVLPMHVTERSHGAFRNQPFIQMLCRACRKELHHEFLHAVRSSTWLNRHALA